MIGVDRNVHSSRIVDVTRTIDGATTAPPDQYAGIIADFRASMFQLKCASSERLVRLGISMAQLHILYTVQRSGEMTMSHLADVLNVSLSSATGLVDRIAERGYVERIRPPEDRRVVRIRLTDEGSRMLEEIDAISDELLRAVLGRLGRSQLAGVALAVSDLRAALEATTAINAPAGPLFDPPPTSHRVSTSSPRSRSTLGSLHTAGLELATQTPARKD